MKKTFISFMGLSIAMIYSAPSTYAANCQIVNGVRVCDSSPSRPPSNPPPSKPSRPPSNPPSRPPSNPPPSTPSRPPSNPPSRPPSNPPPSTPSRPPSNPPGNPPTRPLPPQNPPGNPPTRPLPPQTRPLPPHPGPIVVRPQPPQRHCYVDAFGTRDCYIDPGHGGTYRPLPPQRPTYPTRPYYPPHYPNTTCRPRPVTYYPPVYYPAPVYRPAWDYNRAQSLVYNLEYYLSQTLWMAEDEADQTHSQQQVWAAYKLDSFRDDVMRLRDELSLYPYSPGYSSSRYRDVKRSFEDARESMYWAYFSIQIDEMFDRVENTVYDLENVYWGY